MKKAISPKMSPGRISAPTSSMRTRPLATKNRAVHRVAALEDPGVCGDRPFLPVGPDHREIVLVLVGGALKPAAQGEDLPEPETVDRQQDKLHQQQGPKLQDERIYHEADR
ncbi:MAG: hypothetical protein ACE368_04975 [Paracoccaceae bacterium]